MTFYDVELNGVKYVLKAAKIFTIFNMLEICYKNFNGITFIINDSAGLSTALRARHFAGK